jgi:hypothetical protein
MRGHWLLTRLLLETLDRRCEEWRSSGILGRRISPLVL